MSNEWFIDIAIVTITAALIFYTIGVLGERREGSLKKKHVLIFWLGLLFDTIGTTSMSFIAKGTNSNGGISTGGLHGITGALAIILMFIHAIWATFVLYKGNEENKLFFHKFSMVVWIIWLIPYFIGVFMGVSH
ncbi:HsmA family protein [Clostridium sp.]|uniref:HsmA family protein n=1 Tax=Clostridium sp. TaxID=1506 RepID=UPI003463CDBF